MKDYLLVGFGLSGSCLAFQLQELGKSFMVYTDESQQASKVAGGLMNPVILKRFTLAWKADTQLDYAYSFYSRVEDYLNESFVHPLPLLRRFSSIEEQNNWFHAGDKAVLSRFLSPNIVSELPGIKGQFGFGKVQETARLLTRAFLTSLERDLSTRGRLRKETFHYEELSLENQGARYRGESYGKVIFCEGFGAQQNPYFNYLPLRGNKGEYLIIRAPDLKLKVGVKSSVFLFPISEDLYAVGATYDARDASNVPTEKAKKELLARLEELVQVPFEVVNQIAGIRPATIDRRPMAGKHPVYPQLFYSNGFGSRGVLLGPWVSDQLVQYAEKGIPLSKEIDLDRFTKKWFPGQGRAFEGS